MLKSGQAQPQPAAASAEATASPETAAAAAAPVAPTQEAAVSIGGASGSGASKALNTDISIIGDFIATAGHNPIEPGPSLEMHESEIGMSARSAQYVHPSEDAVLSALDRLGGHNFGHNENNGVNKLALTASLSYSND